MNLFTTDWSKCFQDGIVATDAPPKLSCIWIVLQNVINASLAIAGIAAVFLIVFSGIQYIMSRGDKERIEEARKRLTWAIIGLIFIVSSFLIITFISQFTGVGLNQLTTPPGQ